MSKRQRRFGFVSVKIISRGIFFVILAAFLLIPGGRNVAFSAINASEQAALQAELSRVEAEKVAAEKQLSEARNQSASLSRDITILNTKIKAAQLDIKAKNLLIQTLGNDITAKEKHIDALEARIEEGKKTMADLLRKARELDGYSFPQVLLSQKTVSGFFNEFDTFEAVQNGLLQTFEQLRADQAEANAEKDALDARRNAEIDAKYAIQQQEASIKKDQTQKQNLLSISKGNEKAYASLVAEKAARAAKIRSELFALRDSAAIPFGDAYRYALAASRKTGVRPAFILAILTQESALGKNVGSCYLTDQTTGAGINSKTGRAISKVMNPTRDVPPFLQILRDLGGDYNRTVVSCPQSIGWGGAMGPAQFIASTWTLLIERLKSALGVSIPDPWNPEHAIMASAMYLGDLGAGNGGYTAERNAACKYYSGSSCPAGQSYRSSLRNQYYNGKFYSESEYYKLTYGNSVISKANTIQTTMIDLINGY